MKAGIILWRCSFLPIVSGVPGFEPDSRCCHQQHAIKHLPVSEPARELQNWETGHSACAVVITLTFSWWCLCLYLRLSWKPSGKGKRLPEVYCIVSRLGCFNLFSKVSGREKGSLCCRPRGTWKWRQDQKNEDQGSWWLKRRPEMVLPEKATTC